MSRGWRNSQCGGQVLADQCRHPCWSHLWYSGARRHWNIPDLREGHDWQDKVWQQEQHTEHWAGGQSGSRGQGRSPAEENRGQISNSVLTDHFIYREMLYSHVLVKNAMLSYCFLGLFFFLHQLQCFGWVFCVDWSCWDGLIRSSPLSVN